MKSLVRPLVAAGLAIAAATSAHGGPSLGAGSQAGIDAAPPGDVQTYSTFNPSDVATSHSLTTSSSAFGSAANGSLVASAGSMTMHSYSSVVNPNANGCSCSLLVAQQDDKASFTDRVVLSSATLAVGTPVDLLVSMVSHDSFSSSQPTSLYLKAGYLADFIVGAVSLYANDPVQFPNLGSAVLHAFVGESIDLSASMELGTYAEYIDATARSISGDATTQFHLDPLSGGVTVVSDSGHDYATAAVSAVPEPSELALLLAGFAAIGGVGTLRRRAANGRQREVR
jgi:hypothetical protein